MILEFGTQRPAVDYRKRPGVYAVATDAGGQWAAIKTSHGYFLLGGAIEPEESAGTALQREIIEESGCAARIISKIGDAVEYIDTEGEGSFAIHGTFFKVELGAPSTTPTEPDHILVWLSLEDALCLLRREAARWAVGKAATE